MGHAKSAARFARDLGLPVTAGNKERLSDTEVTIDGIVGQQVHGYQSAIIYDDDSADDTVVGCIDFGTDYTIPDGSSLQIQAPVISI